MPDSCITMPGEAINSPQDFSVSVTVSIHSSAGLEIKFRGAPLHLQEVMCIETNTSLVYLQKFEEAAGEFKGIPPNFQPCSDKATGVLNEAMRLSEINARPREVCCI